MLQYYLPITASVIVLMTASFTPNLPSGWDDIKISELPVGDNIVSFAVNKNGNSTEYALSSENADWTYKLHLKGLRGTKYVLNGRTLTANSDEIQLQGKLNRIITQK